VNKPILPQGDVPRLEQQLSAINQMIYAGQYAQAQAAAQQLAAIAQVRVPALALQALAAAMAGERDTALELLKEFTDPAALTKAEIALAVGSAWFKLGEMAQAIGFLGAGVALQPAHPLLVARLAACLLAVGRVPDALPLLHKAVELLPDSGGTWLNLARAQLMLGQGTEAMASLDKAEPFNDKEPALYRMTRAEALARLDRHTEAEALLRQAVADGQDGAVPALVSQLGARGQHDEAWTVLREALADKPDEVNLLELAAELAQVRGRFGEADHFLDRALQKDPDNAALWTRRAMVASRGMGGKPGREAADNALALTLDKSGPPRAAALAAHAHVLAEEEKHQEAEAAYREAIAVFPNCIPAMNGLGHLLMQRGKVDEATALFEELKKIAPLQGWSQLIHAREVPDDPKVLEQMALAAHRPSLEGPVQSHLLFTLAAAWEKKKDFEQAWQFATEANAAAKEHLPYRPEVHRQRVDREMARFSKAFMDSRKGWGSPSPVPTFVLGMPRSGTTLVEQILGSHSQVFGAGELSLVPELIQKLSGWEQKLGTRREYPECIDDMAQGESLRFAEKHLQELQAYAPQAQRIVDKLPHNFEHIGLIKLMFPNAKILHLKREPRDVAMSNFFTDYAAKFGGMGFAYDLSWIGEQLVDHQRLMDHWHTVFAGQILEVDYDLLVEDVDGWAHKIIDYLELPWEEGVLAFQDLERSVKTASVWQVRQPVYTTSKAKWKRYEPHLEALEAGLAEVPPLPVPAPLPRLAPGIFLMAQELLTTGKAAEAEAIYRKLLQARPSHAAAHHFLGAALYQLGRVEEARKAMRRSLELLPGNLQWLENLKAAEAAMGNTAEVENLDALIARRKAGQTTPTEATHELA
jgi:tetratricopeptide (TPR) repeat protein